MLKLGSFDVVQSRAIFITKWVSFDVLAQKAGQMLLKSRTGITKLGNFITKWNRYYKVGQLLRSRAFPVDTGRKLKVHKTFRRRPGRSMYVQFTSCVYRGTS